MSALHPILKEKSLSLAAKSVYLWLLIEREPASLVDLERAFPADKATTVISAVGELVSLRLIDALPRKRYRIADDYPLR